MTAFEHRIASAWKPLLVSGALAFTYSTVLWKLGYDWWTDDNYSHGLLVPFVVGYIVWYGFDRLRGATSDRGALLGLFLIIGAALMLLVGTMAAVLFAQRLSLLIMAAGVLVYFFGTGLVKRLALLFLLLLLSIPIPQLFFNKIAFPLQLLASRVADDGIRFLGIPVDRKGNVLEIVPAGSTDIVRLEVVEACSGIRSLMTLITLALILGYFTSERRQRYADGLFGFFTDRDVQRTVFLMVAAVPVALVTNAARVITTGLLAYYFGEETVNGFWHDISGSVVFLSALVILFGLNFFIKGWFGGSNIAGSEPMSFVAAIRKGPVSVRKTVTVFLAVVFCGVFVNWFQYRGEVHVARKPLNEIPRQLGSWEQRNEDIRFDPETEKVLRASDYVMRDYYGPGKRLNLYVGYYASQRSGATYHSPLSCLPGTGWEMVDPELVEVSTPGGHHLTVNQYVVQRGEHKEYLIYWYQGRGRTAASEYVDRFYTSYDSLTMRRSDGGMVRIMTPFGKDPARSLASAMDLTSHVADNIGQFLPD